MIYTLTLNPAVDRELTVPVVEFDAVLRAIDARIDFGGKGFNVSRLLKGMGVASTAVGFLGGRTGEILQDGLLALGIDTDFVWVPDETRTNISIVTPSHSHYLKVNEKGPVVDPAKQEELLGKIDFLTRPGDWWVLAGSLPPGVTDDFYARIIRVLHLHQAKAIHRQEQLVRPGILQQQEIACRTADADVLQTAIQADSVVNMHHIIARL